MIVQLRSGRIRQKAQITSTKNRISASLLDTLPAAIGRAFGTRHMWIEIAGSPDVDHAAGRARINSVPNAKIHTTIQLGVPFEELTAPTASEQQQCPDWLVETHQALVKIETFEKLFGRRRSVAAF